MTITAVLTVIAVTLSVLFRMVVNAVPGYREELEDRVEKSVGHPTRIGSMELTWTNLRPTLELRDVALLDAASDKPLLEADRLSFSSGFLRLISGDLTPSRIEASGIELDADIDASGHWSLRGFEQSGGEAPTDKTALLTDLDRFQSIRAVDSKLTLHDARLSTQGTEQALRFDLRSARITHSGQRHVLVATLDPPETIAKRVTLRAVLEGEPAKPAEWQGDWQLAVEHLAGWPWLGEALSPGVELAFERSGLKLDGRIENGQVQNALVDLQVGALTARQAGHVRAQLVALQMRARAAPMADGAWRADVEQLALIGHRGAWNIGATSIVHASNAEGGSVSVDAEHLRLDDIAPWLALARALPHSAQRLRDLHGDVEALKLRLTSAQIDGDTAAKPQVDFSARLRDVGVSGSVEQPALSGLEGQLDGSLDHGRLMLDGSPLRLKLPELFEQDLPIESLRGELAWQREGEDWQLTAPALDLRMLGTQVDGDVALRLVADPEALPLLKLHLHMRSTDVAVLKPLMPKTWGPNTRAWLNRALTRAKITQGEMKIDAPMTPRAPDGHMTMPWRLDLDIADADLDYAQEWPPVTAVDGKLSFHDGGVEIFGDSGELLGNHISHIAGSIADFHGADLVLGGSVAGDGADLYHLLRSSPMKNRLGGLLRVTDASGPVTADVHLRLPLDVPNAQVQASGEVHFDNAQLAIRGVEKPLTNLRGNLAFGGAGMTAEAISARLYDTALTARIRPEEGVPEGVLVGEMPFQPGASNGVEQAFIPSWLRSGLSGKSTMQLRLPFAGPDSGTLSLLSDLRGVTSTLPPPLAKQPDESFALRVNISGDADVPLRLQVQAGDALRAGLRLAEVDGTMQTRGVELRVGPGETPTARGDGLVIFGAPATLDLVSWSKLVAAAQSGNGSLPFTRADLQPQRVTYHGYVLGPTHLMATPAANNSLHITLDGAAVGQVDLQRNDGGRVVARLQRAAFEPPPAPVPGAPVTPVEASKPVPFDPGDAPLLDIDCEGLKLGDVDFGHFGLITSRVPDGQKVERLQLAGGVLIVDAHGTWLRRGEGDAAESSANMTFDVGSSEIADVLKVFGYAPNLRAKDAQFGGRLTWSPAADGLEFALAEGAVKLDVKRGTIKSIEPGAGRVLGLINLYALPRRLLFDFRDVVSEGLAFDTLKGSFKLAHGNADTTDVQLNGPQAKVQLAGRVGLATRDYDQHVTVTPDISTGVTVGAALLGGPIGGGIALVAQQLFGKPFNRLARFSYRVTGSWDNPEVIKGTESAAPPLPLPPKPAKTGVKNG